MREIIPFIVFFALAIGLLFIGSKIVKKVKSTSWKFILFGVLVAMIAVGFDILLPTSSNRLTESLMKIAFIIVLGGVGTSLLGPGAGDDAWTPSFRK